MATILNLKKSIKTIGNVSKTTRAMQMIAASKLKRAQEAALASRPYVNELTKLSENLSIRLKETKQPLYMKKQNNPTSLIIVLSPDKGLCGGLVTNLLRESTTNAGEKPYIITVGKKASQYFARKDSGLIASFDFGSTLPSFETIFPIIEIINDYFISEKAGNVKVLYTHFENLFSQKPTFSTLLPISLPENKIPSANAFFELFEPSAEEILPDLLKHYIEMSLYQYLLESHVSEQASRMIAMQNATENAKEIIGELSLEYNKARQDKITKEILDISNASFSFAYEH